MLEGFQSKWMNKKVLQKERAERVICVRSSTEQKKEGKSEVKDFTMNDWTSRRTVDEEYDKGKKAKKKKRKEKEKGKEKEKEKEKERKRKRLYLR